MIDTICKLSNKDRLELVSSQLVDQPRNLTITDPKNITSVRELEYLIKLTNGDVVLKYSNTTSLSEVKTVLYFVMAERHKVSKRCELSIELPYNLYRTGLSFSLSEAKVLGYLKSAANPCYYDQLQKDSDFKKLILTNAELIMENLNSFTFSNIIELTIEDHIR